MIDIDWIQAEQDEWQRRNFGEPVKHQPLLGLTEEVGELAHAHLKHEQGIRGVDTVKFSADAQDAIGDIMLYLMAYCNANGFVLSECLSNTWNQVQKRNWRDNPDTGREYGG